MTLINGSMQDVADSVIIDKRIITLIYAFTGLIMVYVLNYTHHSQLLIAGKIQF
jgi:hypothetical protein